MFKLIKKLENGVRIGELTTPHGVINTPFFMPVGTVGSVKGVSPQELKDLGAEIILCNTYHLFLRPGEQTIKELGGLHQFMCWNGPILTDSGGYQVFSLSRKGQEGTTNFLTTNDERPNSNSLAPGVSGERVRVRGNNFRPEADQPLAEAIRQFSNKQSSLVRIYEDGVEFKSHLDGTSYFFTPEKVIQIQLDLGVDILMPLDYCPNGKADAKELKRSVDLTIKWAERSKKYFDKFAVSSQQLADTRKQQTASCRPLLHGIVQGGLDPDLRKYCAKKLIEMNFDGYSVGGLAVDMETRDMWDIVKLMGEILPEHKQRYLMGVGTPDDIIKATQLGMDMFDCVLPTRMARHGSVYCRTMETLPLGERGANTRGVGRSEPTSLPAYKLTNLLNSQYRTDAEVIDQNCDCPACKGGFSKAYISHLLRSKEILGLRLATLHNLHQYLNLMRDIRTLK